MHVSMPKIYWGVAVVGGLLVTWAGYRSFVAKDVVRVGDAQVVMTQDARAIETVKIQAGHLSTSQSLPGEIQFDPDKLAHVSPRTRSTIRSVFKKVGDSVEAGERLAVAESTSGLVLFDLKSLISGTVIERRASVGEVIAEGQEAFVVADLESVLVRMTARQKDLAAFKTGQQVVIQDRQGHELGRGAINYIAPVLDDDTGTAIVTASVPNPKRDLKPGLFIDSKVVLAESDAALVLPRSSVVRYGARHVVYQKKHGEEFKQVDITIGKSDGSAIEVVAGLNAQDEVALHADQVHRIAMSANKQMGP